MGMVKSQNNKKKILVFGGAGYIGSHVVKALLDAEYTTAVYDNLSTGRQSHIKHGAKFYKASILNRTQLTKTFTEFLPTAVVHLAAEKSVGKSMSNANVFSETNIVGTINILRAMSRHNVKHIVFSSSAAVFGEPQYLPIDENHPTRPINYYGSTKKIMEEIMHWYDKVYNITYSALRYFNAAGHTPDTDITVLEKNPQNLIPVILETARGNQKKLQIFGKDYKTHDGTCVRDYIHVCDLADAHVLSIEHLIQNNPSVVLNLGTGRGFSVKEVYDVAREITGKTIPMEYAPPRPGDPPALYAKSIRAQKILGWKPKYKKVKEIVEHAWLSYCR